MEAERNNRMYPLGGWWSMIRCAFFSYQNYPDEGGASRFIQDLVCPFSLVHAQFHHPISPSRSHPHPRTINLRETSSRSLYSAGINCPAFHTYTPRRRSLRIGHNRRVVHDLQRCSHIRKCRKRWIRKPTVHGDFLDCRDEEYRYVYIMAVE